MTSPRAEVPSPCKHTTEPRRAEQDGEYLHDAHVVIAAALSDVIEEPIAHDYATWVLDALADAVWHLYTYDDAQSLLADHVLSRVR